MIDMEVNVGKLAEDFEIVMLYHFVFKLTKNKTTKQKGQVSETIIPSEIVWCYFEIVGCKASVIILSYIVYKKYIFEFYSDFTSDCVIGEINHIIGKKNIQAIYF